MTLAMMWMMGKVRKLNRIWGWVDADFPEDLDTRRPYTGYDMMMMNGGAYQLEVCEAEECVSLHDRKRVVCCQ